MQNPLTPTARANSEWQAFKAKLETAQAEFARGRPGDFKALWSHCDDATICGGLGGGVDLGWDKVAARLDWASANYTDGARTWQEISGTVGSDFAYLVQLETIDFRVAGRTDTIHQVLRSTMVFRRESDGWRILHRHADSQTTPRVPR